MHASVTQACENGGSNFDHLPHFKVATSVVFTCPRCYSLLLIPTLHRPTLPRYTNGLMGSQKQLNDHLCESFCIIPIYLYYSVGDECAQFPLAEYADYNAPNKSWHNDLVEVVCTDGYAWNGEPEFIMRCNESHTWEPYVTECTGNNTYHSVIKLILMLKIIDTVNNA